MSALFVLILQKTSLPRSHSSRSACSRSPCCPSTRALSAIEKTCDFSQMSAKKGRSTGEILQPWARHHILAPETRASGSDPFPSDQLAIRPISGENLSKMVKTFLKMVKNIERLTFFASACHHRCTGKCGMPARAHAGLLHESALSFTVCRH